MAEDGHSMGTADFHKVDRPLDVAVQVLNYIDHVPIALLKKIYRYTLTRIKTQFVTRDSNNTISLNERGN